MALVCVLLSTMKRLLLLACLFASPLFAKDDEPPPTAEQIMQLVRMSYALQEGKLTGSLRDDKSGKEEPFTLTMTQQIIRFLFDNPKQVVHLDLSAVPPLLREVRPGFADEVELEQYGDKVRGFDLNYEDLSLRFLYWPDPKLLGEENVALGQKAWKIRITTPDALGPYGTVDIWVHQDSGGMAKMEGWDRKGNLVRRYAIKSVQKVNKTHIPKEMRIDSFDPATKKTIGITYMEFDKPAKE